MNPISHVGKVQGAIAFVILAGFFAALYLLINAKIEAGGMRDALLTMVGSLGAMATSVVSYYFGSSSGSAEKTRLLGAKE